MSCPAGETRCGAFPQDGPVRPVRVAEGPGSSRGRLPDTSQPSRRREVSSGPARGDNAPLPEQARLFLQTAAETGERLEALYALAIHLGLRQGELLGLKWEDVDLEASTLQIRRGLSGSNDGHPVFTTPKSAKSRRQVRLTAGATEALKRQLTSCWVL